MTKQNLFIIERHGSSNCCPDTKPQHLRNEKRNAKRSLPVVEMPCGCSVVDVEAVEEWGCSAVE